MIHESSATPNVPIYKLNLMYKLEKTPILSLKCVYGDGKASRLYVRGDSASSSSNMLQIVLLNEHMETHTIKLGLPLSEPCFDCQSRSPPSLPKQINIRIPFVDLSISVSKFVTNAINLFGATNEDYNLLAKNYSPLIHVDAKAKDENHMSSVHFNGHTSINNLYITGHIDGTINFWDVSCPFPLPIALLKHQNEDNHFGRAIPVTAMHFDIAPRILIYGDQSGVVRIFKFKIEPFSSDSSLFSLQAIVLESRFSISELSPLPNFIIASQFTGKHCLNVKSSAIDEDGDVVLEWENLPPLVHISHCKVALDLDIWLCSPSLGIPFELTE
ncbi:hypothetical protein Syun_014637 [Stephania yunnanensis]|uniref:Uncharacterized protein n=1 Tax=Stephania yunnanensis TaxID=152371 RepID=A0AAP0P8Z8_9MAGN